MSSLLQSIKLTFSKFFFYLVAESSYSLSVRGKPSPLQLIFYNREIPPFSVDFDQFPGPSLFIILVVQVFFICGNFFIFFWLFYFAIFGRGVLRCLGCSLDDYLRSVWIFDWLLFLRSLLLGVLRLFLVLLGCLHLLNYLLSLCRSLTYGFRLLS